MPDVIFFWSFCVKALRLMRCNVRRLKRKTIFLKLSLGEIWASRHVLWQQNIFYWTIASRLPTSSAANLRSIIQRKLPSLLSILTITTAIFLAAFQLNQTIIWWCRFVFFWAIDSQSKMWFSFNQCDSELRAALFMYLIERFGIRLSALRKCLSRIYCCSFFWLCFLSIWRAWLVTFTSIVSCSGTSRARKLCRWAWLRTYSLPAPSQVQIHGSKSQGD